jgi:peptidoglycan/xylan/chitin deacetylase (PgdA/CDA1 family)
MRPSPRSILVLAFHGVGSLSREHDPGEAQSWLPPDVFASVLDLVAQDTHVRLTFDDGNASDVFHALPALLERGLTASFFPVVERIGQPGFVDADGLHELRDAGMNIGLHGLRHRSWRHLGSDEAREELWDARKRLSALVEQPVHEAACPFGQYDRRVLRLLRETGVRRVYTSDGGWALEGRWLQPRVSLRREGALRTVERSLTDRGRRPALIRRATLAAKRWR